MAPKTRGSSHKAKIQKVIDAQQAHARQVTNRVCRQERFVKRAKEAVNADEASSSSSAKGLELGLTFFYSLSKEQRYLLERWNSERTADFFYQFMAERFPHIGLVDTLTKGIWNRYEHPPRFIVSLSHEQRALLSDIDLEMTAKERADFGALLADPPPRVYPRLASARSSPPVLPCDAAGKATLGVLASLPPELLLSILSCRTLRAEDIGAFKQSCLALCRRRPLLSSHPCTSLISPVYLLADTPPAPTMRWSP
jgi:hypothetical protein